MISGSGRKVLPDVCKRSEGPPGCTGMVERLSGMSGSSREVLPEVRE